MKIIKIVVDKKPKKCITCDFSIQESSLSTVVIFGCVVHNHDRVKWNSVPEWCPLIVEENENE